MSSTLAVPFYGGIILIGAIGVWGHFGRVGLAVYGIGWALLIAFLHLSLREEDGEEDTKRQTQLEEFDL